MKISLYATMLGLVAGGVVMADQKPNIILVLVDDMGWGDTSVNASSVKPDKGKKKAPEIETPNMEKMARGGVQLRRHYTAAPVCAPARASLFSGTHQGHTEVVRNNSFDAALEDSHTLASVLKAAGYDTALIGKWGIGGGKEGGGTPTTAAAWPTKRGFDYFFGYHNHIAGHRHYPKEESNVDPDMNCNAVWDGETCITDSLDNCYSTDLFTARAKKWIVDQQKANPDRPFFLALTLIAPHARLAVPCCPYPKGGGLKGGVQWLGKPGRMINTAKGNWDSYIEPAYKPERLAPYAKGRFPNNPNIVQSASRHATMVTRIDDALGDLMQLCRDLKINDHTFIVFTSDNGPHNEPGAVSPVAGHPAPAQNPAFFRSYGHFDGIKRDVWEGGLRVPCLVWAPGIVKAGKVSKRPSQFHDWMATFADLAGVPKPMRCDGVSLLPMLKGRDAEQKDGVVYSEYNINAKMDFYDDYAANKRNRTRGEQQVIVFRDAKGRFLKALRTNVKTGEEDFEIYDVEADPHESKNLADEYADMQEKLRTAALYNRRAYDYVRDAQAGKRRNPCSGTRCYDGIKVPANSDLPELQPGLTMRRVQAECPWVPEFDTLPQAAAAKAELVANPSAVELPAGSITEFRGYIDVPADGDHWHFTLQLDKVPGSKAYVKMHNFQLIDADANYEPGTKATESAAANADEAVAGRTGVKGVPLKAGLHEVTIVVVQGPSAPGKMKLEWFRGQQAPVAVPADAFRTAK